MCSSDLVTPVQIREAIYQLAPFIGFPRTLNAVGAVNKVFRDYGITLPLPDQGGVRDAERYERGLAGQAPLYGEEIKDNLADLPEPFNEALPRFLTEFCFGDFYTRGGLTLAQRELLALCALATIGDTSAKSWATSADRGSRTTGALASGDEGPVRRDRSRQPDVAEPPLINSRQQAKVAQKDRIRVRIDDRIQLAAQTQEPGGSGVDDEHRVLNPIAVLGELLRNPRPAPVGWNIVGDENPPHVIAH